MAHGLFDIERASQHFYTHEEMAAHSANGLASNSPIDSNDSPGMIFHSCLDAFLSIVVSFAVDGRLVQRATTSSLAPCTEASETLVA